MSGLDKIEQRREDGKSEPFTTPWRTRSSSHGLPQLIFSGCTDQGSIMFPDKNRMVRQANILLVMLGISPAVYIVIATIVVFGRPGLARNPEIILPVLLGLIAVSVVNIGVLAFTQTNQRFLEKMVKTNPVGGTYLVLSTGAILSEALAVYGLVVTLLSGSIIYAIGFSLATWACLIWVRSKFKRNLGKLPDA